MKAKINISNAHASDCSNDIYTVLLVVLGILLILIIIYLSQANKIGQNTYENLTENNNIKFDDISALNSTIPTVVLFYGSKCGSCHEFLPDYQMLREKYKNNDKIRIAIINCDDNPNLGITKFPTIRHYTNPSQKEYKTIFE
jgi:thiol-disulfide isomerase/thioredoxin